MNLAILIGRVGKDPEIKSFQNGGKVANFSLATSEKWKDKNSGEKKEKTEWHNITVFSDGLVGVVERFVKKGDQLMVKGKIQTRKWQDQSGNDRYTTEIVLQGFDAAIEMLGGKSGGNDGGSSSASDSGSYGGSNASSGGGSPFPDDLDDEVPF